MITEKENCHENKNEDAKLGFQNIIVFNCGQLLTIKALNIYRYNCCRYKFVIIMIQWFLYYKSYSILTYCINVS